MKNIKLVIEYDGYHYVGWQRQKNGLAIQQVLENAILKASNEKVIVNGSGRTDARVHAKGQVATFISNSTIPPEKFYKALNIYLPDDIKCIYSELVSDDFHARFSATGKHYRYLIINREVQPAINRNYIEHVKNQLNIENMKKAVSQFVGEYDFTAFMASNSDVKDTTRKIYSATLSVNDDLITIDLKGNGFLYNMVRIIAGTLIEVGMGKIAPDEIKDIILSKNRKRAGRTASASGLYLMEVYYS